MPRRYIVTRPAARAPALSRALRAAGIDPVEVPAVTIAPPESWGPLDGALRVVQEYDWLLLTSASGVDVLFGRAGPDFAWPRTLRWAAIGPGTAGALGARGISEVWIPSRFLGEAVAGEMPATRGQRVLRVRAGGASEIPSEGLRARGVEVSDVIAYRTLGAPAASRGALVEAWAGGVEGVIFTSASTVRGFCDLLVETGLRDEVEAVRLVAIGPVTASALRAEGLTPFAVASEHSVRGIVEALTERSDEHAARSRGA